MDCGGGCGENLEREGLRAGVEQTWGGFRLLYETRACITIHMYTHVSQRRYITYALCTKCRITHAVAPLGPAWESIMRVLHTSVLNQKRATNESSNMYIILSGACSVPNRIESSHHQTNPQAGHTHACTKIKKKKEQAKLLLQMLQQKKQQLERQKLNLQKQGKLPLEAD